MEEAIKVFSLLSGGTILGILIKYLLDLNAKKREMLFIARKQAYMSLSGKLLNYFPDLSKLQYKAERSAKINEIFSEVYLFGSKKLIKNIEKYKKAIVDLHQKLIDNLLAKKDTKDDKIAEKLHKDCSKLVEKIIDNLRKDLFL